MTNLSDRLREVQKALADLAGTNRAAGYHILNHEADIALADLPAIISEVEALDQNLESMRQTNAALLRKLSALEVNALVEEVTGALMFYADDANWSAPMGVPKAREDQGDRARAALSSLHHTDCPFRDFLCFIRPS